MAESEKIAVEKKEEAKDTHSSNTVTKESETHDDNMQIQGAEALSEQVEIAVAKMQEAKHTDSLNTVTKESETQEAEAVSEQAEIAVKKTQEEKHTDSLNTVTKESETEKESETHDDNVQIQGAEAISEQVEIAVEKMQEVKHTDSSNTVTKESETQEVEAVSENAKLQIDNRIVSPIVNIENETVLEIELGTSELLTEPESNVVSIVPESNILSIVNTVESVTCDANIRTEHLTHSENEYAPPEVIFPKPVIPSKLMEGDTSDDSGIGESLQQSLQCGEKKYRK